MRPLVQQMKKPWVVMPLVALLAFGGWFVFRPGDEASDAQATATDQVVEATVGTMAKTVSADGTIAAADSEDLSFGSAGTVTAVNVQAGDVVKAGDVLAEIDSADLAADVSSAEAGVAEAEAKLADDEDADASDAQLTADESSLASAQDQLDAANEALEGAQLKATIDGTVASVGITVGEELASGGAGGTDQTGSDSGSGDSSGSLPDSGGMNPDSGDDSSTSTADIALVSTGRFIVDLGFDDTDIANVKVGQSASVAISTSSSSSNGFPGGGMFPGMVVNGNAAGSADAATGDDTTGDDTGTAAATPSATGGVEGFVSEVGTVADASSGVASYPVTVAFADTSGDYNVGASVTVEITYAEVADAVQVPAFAVSTATDGTSTVEVKTESGTETRTVTTGLTSGTMVQITEGLSAGESVVISMPGRPTGGDSDEGSGDSGTQGGGMPTGGPMQGGPAFTQGGGS